MISTTSEYALRALVHLSKAPEDGAILGRDLARATGVPPNYLSKILLSLRNAGYLTTARGSGGGYKLASSPDEIFLIDVVELFEGSKAKPVCFLSHTKSCGEEDACTAHKAWRELSMAYRGFLVSTTVSMIASPAPKPKSSGEVDVTRQAKPDPALAALAVLAR
jgi:Rrf2 family protein